MRHSVDTYAVPGKSHSDAKKGHARRDRAAGRRTSGLGRCAGLALTKEGDSMSTRLDSLRLPEPNKVYRVVQWATGRIGQSSLAELIRSPQMKVVGVYVHSDAKDGKDAGELCGLPPIGVKATRSIEKIIALKPDCIVANQEGANVDDVCRFLEAGINVATSRVDYLEPDYMSPDVRRRVEEACRKGNASIHATGASPGFSSEMLPLAVASMTRRMECMTIDEFADVPASCPDVQCVAMGFGRSGGGDLDPNLLAHIAHGFQQSVNLVAKALNLPLERFELLGETAGATERFLLPGGTPIEKGAVAAQRITISGMRNGRAIIRYRINWYCSTQVDKAWELRRSGWRMLIEGETPIEVNITFPVSGEKLSPAMAAITAYRVINAVPFVCAAVAGIRTTADLPIVVPAMNC
jgi:2,4-diaminopentanoate dehydrogenase